MESGLYLWDTSRFLCLHIMTNMYIPIACKQHFILISGHKRNVSPELFIFISMN